MDYMKSKKKKFHFQYFYIETWCAFIEPKVEETFNKFLVTYFLPISYQRNHHICSQFIAISW